MSRCRLVDYLIPSVHSDVHLLFSHPHSLLVLHPVVSHVSIRCIKSSPTSIDLSFLYGLSPSSSGQAVINQQELERLPTYPPRCKPASASSTSSPSSPSSPLPSPLLTGFRSQAFHGLQFLSQRPHTPRSLIRPVHSPQLPAHFLPPRAFLRSATSRQVGLQAFQQALGSRVQPGRTTGRGQLSSGTRHFRASLSFDTRNMNNNYRFSCMGTGVIQLRVFSR